MRQPLDVQYLGAGSHTSFNSHAKTLDHNVEAVRLAVYSAMKESCRPPYLHFLIF